MNRSALQAILYAARARLATDQAAELARSGLPSGLAYLALPLLAALAAHPDRGEVSDLLLELVGKAQRRPLLDLLGDDLLPALAALASLPELAAACQALIVVLSDDTADDDSAVSQRMSAGTISHAKQIVATNYYEAGADPQRDRAQRALIDYLRGLGTRCGAIDLGRMVSDEGLNRTPIRLEQVYIDLMVERRSAGQDLAQADERPRRAQAEDRRSALAAFDRAHPARMVLLGGPGSGKSTFTNYLTLCLAGACLGREEAADAAQGAALLERLKPAWSREPLLPIRIVLRELAAFAPLSQAKRGDLALLHQFLGQALGAQSDALAPLAAALSAGKAILIFDGLDEVVGAAVIDRVTECIAAAAGTYTHSPILLTCRLRDFNEQPRYQLPGFVVEVLDAFDDQQIERFIAAWHHEFIATGRQPLGAVADLRRALGANAELRELARQPLLLTMIAIVHAAMGKLPDSRSQLYHECVKLLLLSWRKEKGQPDVLSLLGLPQFHENDLLRMAALLGFVAHDQAERTAAQADRPADLSRATVREELERAFAPYAPDLRRREELASIMLHQIADRNGLLLKQSSVGGEVYTFPHRSIQEFLAGVYLSQRDDWDVCCLNYAGKGHWHEALKLMVSYQVLVQGLPGPPLQFVRDLLEPERTPLEVALAGELLALVGYERATSRAGWAGPKGRWAAACAQLRDVATASGPTAAPAALRARAALALGLLCYGSLTALTGPSPNPPAADPRLLDPLTGSSVDSGYWCAIDQGPFWYGDETEDEQLQQVAIPYAYQIARYTVTNAEFARFIADRGYDREELWTPEGWKYFQEAGSGEEQEQQSRVPYYWDDPDLNNPLQPVVGISWYEAAAYCRWLTRTGQQADWLSAGEVIRLPTSWEWERAARHTDHRAYPWRDGDPTPEHANYDQTSIEYTAAVGCFPMGAAQCGALDMVGNVSEWLATLWESDEPGIPEKDFTPDQSVMLTYSYYGCAVEHLSCGARDGGYPLSRIVNFGFRIIQSLGSSE